MSSDNSKPASSPQQNWRNLARRSTLGFLSASSSSKSFDNSRPVTSKDDVDSASIKGKGADDASINLTKPASKGLLGGLRRKGSVASMDQAASSSSSPPPPTQPRANDESDRASVRSRDSTTKNIFGIKRRGTSSGSLDKMAAPEPETSGNGGTRGEEVDADVASVKGKSPGKKIFGLKKKTTSSGSLDRMSSPLAQPAATADDDNDSRASIRSKSPSRSFLGMKIRRNTSSGSLEQLQQEPSSERLQVKKKPSRTGSLLSFGKKNPSKVSLDITPPGSTQSNPGSRAPTPPPTHAGYIPSPIAESPMREAEAMRQEQQGSSLAQQAHVVFDEPEEEIPKPKVEDANAEAEAAFLSSPTAYVPPPVLDSTAGNPGAFMDDPDGLPQPSIVRDPWGAGGSGHAAWQQEMGYVSSPDSAARGAVLPVASPVAEPAVDVPDATVASPVQVVERDVPVAIPVVDDAKVASPVVEPEAGPVTAVSPIVERGAGDAAVVSPIVEAGNDDVTVVSPVAERGLGDAPVASPVAEKTIGDAPVASPVAEKTIGDAPVASPVAEKTIGVAPVVSPVAERAIGVAPVVSPVAERGVGGTTVVSPVYAVPQVPVEEEEVDITKGEAAEYYNPPPEMPVPEPHPHVSPQPEVKPLEPSPTQPQDISIGSPKTFEPSPDHRYSDYQWTDKPKGVELPYDGPGESVYIDPGTRGIEMPQPEPYEMSPHQIFSPHDEHAYVPTIPSEGSPLLPRPGFFDEDTATWEWEAHRLMSGSSYFVYAVKGEYGMKRVVTDLDMTREEVRRSVGEFLKAKNIGVTSYRTSGTSRIVNDGVVDEGKELYVKALEDHDRITALWKIQKEREGAFNEDDNTAKGKLLKKGRSKRKRRLTMPPPHMLFLELWDIDHVERRVMRRGDDQKDYEVGSETTGYGATGNSTAWADKGKAPIHDDSEVENEDVHDSAYRYWLYVDSHPSHATLPPRAKEEALEILEWAWTDGILSTAGSQPQYPTSGRPNAGIVPIEAGKRVAYAKAPPLFAQEECDELRKALKAFDSHGHQDRPPAKKRPSLSISTGGRSTPPHGHSRSGSQNLAHSYPYAQNYPSSQFQVQNRLIARIYLRSIERTQAYTRPGVPLPYSPFDLEYAPLPPYILNHLRELEERPGKPRERVRDRRQSVFLASKQNKTSWAKITRDFVGLVLCLGIPYLFVKRATIERADGERGVSGAINVNGATGYVVRRREGESTVGMFIMWGVTCVLAATTLSLSIVLITLPASDTSSGSGRWSFTIPRIAALVALIFALASLIASAAVIWRHSHERHSHNLRNSGRRRALPLEGVVVKETLIPSLPIVFLAYGIMALVFAVVMILVRNGTLSHKDLVASTGMGDVLHNETLQTGGGEWRRFSMLIFGGAVGAFVGIGYVVMWG